MSELLSQGELLDQLKQEYCEECGCCREQRYYNNLKEKCMYSQEFRAVEDLRVAGKKNAILRIRELEKQMCETEYSNIIAISGGIKQELMRHFNITEEEIQE